MGAMWAFFICVLTVWLAKGSCLPVGGTNKRNEHVPQRKMEDSSPNELSLKKAIALLQSMESMLGEQEAKEVQLETNDVEVESSVSHVKPVQLKTEKDVPVGTAVDSGTFTFTFTFPFGGGTFSGTFPAGGSASTSGNNNGGCRVADDRGSRYDSYISAGHGGSNSDISAGNSYISAGHGGSNSDISTGNSWGNGGISAGNGGSNSGISAGNSGISAGNGGSNSGISTGNSWGNGYISAGNGGGNSGIYSASDSSYINGSHSASDSSYINGSHSAGDSSYINGSTADGGIFAVPIHKDSLPEAAGRGHLKVGQKLQNKANAESS
ncbi:keratin, type I cytoskeletal 10-like isoform X2 [Sparus aurata]|uniref:keratin, type I cytoskeletal 10-like isoform X2 n=1 Tax=Sparus aurata TaxID=8175 RepID=UPI0011C19FDE|nr:keratin, type I cytoskeletal 10-like isoform X2 [Sparus aurata]